MRLPALGRTGVKLVAYGWLLWFLPSLWGADWQLAGLASNVIMAAGLIDVFVFLIANTAALGAEAGRLSVEADDWGIRFRVGPREGKTREKLAWDEGYRAAAATGRWHWGQGYQAGLSRWTSPPAGQGITPGLDMWGSRGSRELMSGMEALATAARASQRPMPRAPEKRLVPGASPWEKAGIQFPDPPEHSHRDRLGCLQPSFPVHFRTVDDPSSPALPGVVSVHERAVMEAHTDPHDGCPACDAWRAKYDR